MNAVLSWSLVKYVIKAAVRDRLILSLLLLVILGVSIAIFLGSSAVAEKGQFAVVFAAGGLRVAGVIGLVLFVSVYVRRAFDARDVEYLLSRPISRVVFILSHALALSILAAGMAVCVAAGLLVLNWGGHINEGMLLWGASIIAEFVIMANAAFFFAMVLPSAASSSLAVLALYVLARLMGQILGIINAGLGFVGFGFLSAIMQVISLIVPRLDLMGQTSWLIYGSGHIGYDFIVIQLVAYTALLVTASLVDLVRRQF